MKIAIIGANGQLGTDICLALNKAGHEVIELNREIIEVININSVSSVLRQAKPDVIINTAAMHHVEKCERDPKTAFLVNGVGAKNVAITAGEIKTTLIHISTDYVFDGKKKTPYVEDDPVSPLNIYGISKTCGELSVKAYSDKYYIVRTAGLYGLAPCRGKGENFVTKMLRLASEKKEIRIVDDEISTPTWTASLANQIARICTFKTLSSGIIHATDEGQCSWYEFAKEIFHLSSIKIKLIPVKSYELPSIIARPHYSVLENQVLKNAGKNIMQDWKGSLSAYLKSLG